MDIEIDPQAGVPLYRQIAERIQARLAGGCLQPGEQLPPVRELAAQTGVNFNTVARAYRLLDSWGWINTRPGRGTFLCLRLPVEDRKQQVARRKSELTEAYVKEMARLGSSPKETVRWISQAARGSGHEA